jgi:type III restriction enzyme
MSYLYDILVKEFGKREIANTPLPSFIFGNLRPKYGKRHYQVEAFQRYIICHNEDFEGRPKKPFHLLFNMATGSGKTLVMAGLMLYLHQKGYRNFLFFVNSDNIIKKTLDNFLKGQASKYLFRGGIVIDGREVRIKEVENFESADDKNINIKFTTIQQLHIDLNTAKENSVTYEDFKTKKLVLIADEAHHLSSATKKNGELFGTWEGTVLEILNKNSDNILLEFTATLDFESREIADKYQDKVVYKYDLSEFRNDKYSKEISLIRSLYNEKQRIIQALVLNLYRQELALKNNINLKPVILFKAKRTIKESENNKVRFHKLIRSLSAKDIDEIRDTSTVPVVKKAFTFFGSESISSADMARTIKYNFRPENCISANNDEEAEQNQILLNTLEDENNPIRAVFAVQKLNEGWDVLNLFDIVRLYEGRDGRENKPGKTTISEAQLIGRGARYFPFVVDKGQDSYTRKYDDKPHEEMRVLEELYYHTKEDSKYISELKKALIDTGIYEDDDNLVTKQLTLKATFKKTHFYKKGKVVYNKRQLRDFRKIKSLADLGVTKSNMNFALSSGVGKEEDVFGTRDEPMVARNESKDIKLKEIPQHVIRYALSQNPFFHYDSLATYLPNVGSITRFIENEDYLGNVEITFQGPQQRVKSISHADYLSALQSLLAEIEKEIKSNVTEYEGSEYIHAPIQEVFANKSIRVRKGSEREDGQEAIVSDKPWYVYNANHGTSEEKAFVAMFARRFNSLEKKYKNIYLIRNEREVKIFDKKGRAFEPDFLLFCKEKKGRQLTYQVFIEPKGAHLLANDKWKEDFLKEMRLAKTTLKIDTDKYLITGVPFYNYDNENEFKKDLNNTLGMRNLS